jgi:hypothetical protein
MMLATERPPWAWTMARIAAMGFGAFCLAAAVGAATSSDTRVWAAWLAVVAAGLAVGLFALRDRPVAATTVLCASSVLGALAFFWFPPMYVAPLAVCVGSMTTLRERTAA